jgi:hypothetical protein
MRDHVVPIYICSELLQVLDHFLNNGSYFIRAKSFKDSLDDSASVYVAGQLRNFTNTLFK